MNNPVQSLAIDFKCLKYEIHEQRCFTVTGLKSRSQSHSSPHLDLPQLCLVDGTRWCTDESDNSTRDASLHLFGHFTAFQAQNFHTKCSGKMPLCTGFGNNELIHPAVHFLYCMVSLTLFKTPCLCCKRCSIAR